MNDNPLSEKSFSFALRMIRLSRYLNEEKREFVLAKQVLRSGTSIGALVREAQYAQSKADFVHKLTIALKEANETEYWLQLLVQSELINDRMFQSIEPEIKSLLKLLISSIKTTKRKINNA